MSDNMSMNDWINYTVNQGFYPGEFFEDEYEGNSLGDTIKATYGIGTGGIYNRRYGTEATVQVIYSEEVFGLAPKVPYLKSGHPLMSAASATSGGGIALGGAVQTPDVRTYDQGYTTPKLHTKTIAVDKSYSALEGKDDQVSSDQLVRDGISEWKDLIDRSLLTQFDTLAGNNIESIDRLTASSVERGACGETAGDEDFMNVDRSTDTWFNATVKHHSDVPQTYRLKDYEDALADIEKYKGPRGLDAHLVLTGHDTYWRNAQQVGPAIWRQQEEHSVSINGISSDKGTRYSIHTPEINGHPIFRVNHVNQSSISWMYILNQDYMGIKILTPPTTSQSDDIHKTRNFYDEYVPFLHAELYADHGAAHAKIRDIV